MKMKRILTLLLAMVLVFSLTACTKNSEGGEGQPDSGITEDVSDQTEQPDHEMIDVRVVALTGPTALGMLGVIDSFDAYSLYQFEHKSAPDEVVAMLTSGAADIAALPTNVAASLYNKTNGAVQIAALNTLGVLYVLSNGGEVASVADLKGKQLAASGQGSTAEYALNYILNQNGIDPQNGITIDYKAEHAELATQMISGGIKLGMLPEPFVTQVTAKNPEVKVVLDLAKEWENAADNKTAMAMGCIVVRKEFAEQHPVELSHFLDEYKASAAGAVSDPAATAELAEKYKVMDKAVAEKALPKCNIVFMEGDEMKKTVTDFLTVLFEANEKSIGGKMPGEDFFYER